MAPEYIKVRARVLDDGFLRPIALARLYAQAHRVGDHKAVPVRGVFGQISKASGAEIGRRSPGPCGQRGWREEVDLEVTAFIGHNDLDAVVDAETEEVLLARGRAIERDVVPLGQVAGGVEFGPVGRSGRPSSSGR